MNITELQNKLQKLNINISGRDIATIWGMDETSFSRKKKLGTEIKHKNIAQLENQLGISLTKKELLNQSNDSVFVDYYPDVFGSCGSGTFVLSEQKELIQIPNRIYANFSKSKKYSVINAVGDSMSPTINNKDKLIVEHYNGEQIKDNHIYVFCYNEEIFVKRLVKNIDEIIIKSDNPEPMYQVRFIQKEDINNILIIGEIVGLMRVF